jgi:hypothetical protein
MSNPNGRMKDTKVPTKWTARQITLRKHLSAAALQVWSHDGGNSKIVCECMDLLFACKADRFCYVCYPAGFDIVWQRAAQTWIDAPDQHEINFDTQCKLPLRF